VERGREDLRQAGIKAGIELHHRADLVAFYVDLGMSTGMQRAAMNAKLINTEQARRAILDSSRGRDPREQLARHDARIVSVPRGTRAERRQEGARVNARLTFTPDEAFEIWRGSAATSFDFETYLIAPGNQLPRAVCMSWAELVPCAASKVGLKVGRSSVVTAAEGIELLQRGLDAGVRIIGANTAFDSLVSVVNSSKYMRLLRAWVAGLEGGRVHDVLVREKLLRMAAGNFKWEELPGGKFAAALYNLAAICWGRCRIKLSKPLGKHDVDHWRLRFGELDGVPIAQYPDEAYDYSLDDSTGAGAVYIAQEVARRGGDSRIAQNFPNRDPFEDEARQTIVTIPLRAMSAYGLRTDAAAVERLVEEVEAKIEEARVDLVEAGLVRPPSYSRNTEKIHAYIRSINAESFFRVGDEVKLCKENYLTAATALNNGYLYYLANWKQVTENVLWRDALVAIGVVEVEHSRDTKAASARCVAAYAAQGKVAPRTDSYDPATHGELDCISLDADACAGSEDPILVLYSEYQSLAKTLSNDIPMLRAGATMPVHSRFEELKETGRTGSSKPNVQNVRRLPGIRECFMPRPGYVFVDCLVPGTRLLKADLTWQKIETLKAGDELIGFDEKLDGRNTKFRPSIVEHVERSQHPCYRIVTTRGEVTASFNHQWVARRGVKHKRGDTGRSWIRTEHLEVGDTISYFATPWEVEKSPEAGYLAGFFDGEGFTSKGGVGFGQNEGPVLDHVKDLLRARGYELSHNNSKGSRCQQVRVLGGRETALRFLGSIRPVRLLPKGPRHWDGTQTWGKRSVPAEVLSVEFLGMRETVSVKTSTKTFIAEGFLSHNCDYGGLELHTLAQVCMWVLGFSTLGDALKAGRDPHLIIACAILKTTYEDAKARRKAGDAEVDNARTAGKGVNFGRAGGLSAKTFVVYAWTNYRIRMTLEEAQELLDIYDRTWKEMPAYFRWVKGLKDVYFYKLDEETGRELTRYNLAAPWSGRLRAGMSYCAACNSPFQGSARTWRSLAYGWSGRRRWAFQSSEKLTRFTAAGSSTSCTTRS
jgi:hypothetical protein